MEETSGKIKREGGVSGDDGGQTTPTLNHQSPMSMYSQHDKMGEEFDEESPLGGQSSNESENPFPNKDSTSVREAIPPPLVLPLHGQQLSQGATPLIILPVQSEGIPTSGSLPLGRGGPSSPPTPPHGEELKRVLSQQLEYYFSKDNLSSDKYLLSQMDGDNYVPVSVISHFNQVRKLTTDMTLILESLKASTVLQLDEGEEKVRAIPEKRCVLILREIPKETPKQVIVSLFDHEKCPSCVTCEFADNNCWYVTFDSETSTQQAYSYLREDVREFLGQPIRARIKGTTVQRSSGMPKAKHTPFPMQSGAFNGAPPQLPYYQAPPTGMLPWSPTPTIASASQYYDPSNYSPYVANGFTPPQQGAASQVGVAGQSPSAGGVQGFNGNRYSVYPYMGRGEGGDRDGRGGRMGVPNRYHKGGGGGGGDRGHSPPTGVSNGDVPATTTSSERDKGDGRGGGYDLRDHYPSGGSGLGGGGGGGGGGKYRNDDRKIPRLKNTRHSSLRGNQGGSDGDRGGEKNQIPPRQQNKQQPKIDLATAHFPPLPTSTSSENGTTPTSSLPPVTTPPSHTMIPSEDGQKTLSDIVKGNSRPITKEIAMSHSGEAPALIAVDGLHVAVASSVVEKSIASATAKLSLSQGGGGVSTTTPPTTAAPTSVQHADSNTISNQQDNTAQKKLNVNSDPTPLSSSHSVGKDKEFVATPGSARTISSVVANGGPPSHQNAASVAGKPPPLTGQNKAQKNDNKPYYKYYGNYNKYARHSDRDLSSSKPNRNSQVPKGDNKSAPPTSNARNRYKLDKELPLRNRPGNGPPRPPNTKSPKSSKKNFSPHSSQAPPPLPVHSPPGNESNQSSDSSTKIDAVSHSQSGGGAGKSEKLSYAQMAQKKNVKSSGDVQDSSSTDGGSKVTSPTAQGVVTAPPAPPQSKTVKSTSTGCIPAGHHGQSETTLSKSAPTSPTRGVVKVKENEV